MNDLYTLTIVGKADEDTDDAEIHAKLAKAFRKSPDQIQRLLSTVPVVIKKGIDAETAQRFKAVIETAGLRCQLVAEDGNRKKKTHSSDMAAPEPRKSPDKEAIPSDAFIPSQQIDPKVDAEMKSLDQKLLAHRKHFEEQFKHFEKGSGYAQAKSFSDTAIGMAGLIVGAGVWWATRWYWGVIAGIVCGGLVQLLLGRDVSGKASIIARYFFKNLDRLDDSNSPLFWLAMEQWIETLSGQPDLVIQLRSELKNRLDAMDQAALDEARERIDALRRHRELVVELEREKAAFERERDRKAVEAEKRKAGEEEARRRTQEKEKRNRARLAKIRAVFPDACLPVDGNQIRYNPGIGIQSVAGGVRFAVSSNFFISAGGNNYGKAVRIPMHCIKSVDIAPAGEGLSVDALVVKTLGRAFKRQPMRVSVDFHLYLPVVIRGGIHSYSGVSFQIQDWDWPDVEKDWEKFARGPFPPAALCPKCNAYGVSGLASTFAENLGMKNAQIRAQCDTCDSRLVLDPVKGVFLVVSAA